MPRSANHERAAARRSAVVELATTLAERSGWDAVTVRRVADGMGFSLPVLYRAFPGGRDEIISEVAVAGFTRLRARLTEIGSLPVAERIRGAAAVYLSFADDETRVCEAMFDRDLAIEFGAASTPEALRTGFSALAEAIGADDDAEVELFWAALHGLSSLERRGRLPPQRRDARIAALVARFGRPEPSS